VAKGIGREGGGQEGWQREKARRRNFEGCPRWVGNLTHRGGLGARPSEIMASGKPKLFLGTPIPPRADDGNRTRVLSLGICPHGPGGALTCG